MTSKLLNMRRGHRIASGNSSQNSKENRDLLGIEDRKDRLLNAHHRSLQFECRVSTD